MDELTTTLRGVAGSIRTSRYHHFDQGVEQVCSTASGTTALPSCTSFVPLWHFCWTSPSAQTSQLCSELILWVQDRLSLRARLARLSRSRLSAGSTSSGAVGRVFPTATKVPYQDQHRVIDCFRGGWTCFPGRAKAWRGRSQVQKASSREV